MTDKLAEIQKLWKAIDKLGKLSPGWSEGEGESIDPCIIYTAKYIIAQMLLSSRKSLEFRISPTLDGYIILDFSLDYNRSVDIKIKKFVLDFSSVDCASRSVSEYQYEYDQDSLHIIRDVIYYWLDSF